MLAVLDNSSLLFQLQIQATSPLNTSFQNPNFSFRSTLVSQDRLRCFSLQVCLSILFFLPADHFVSLSDSSISTSTFHLICLMDFWLRIMCFWFSVASDILNRNLCSFCACSGKINWNFISCSPHVLIVTIISIGIIKILWWIVYWLISNNVSLQKNNWVSWLKFLNLKVFFLSFLFTIEH